MEGKIKGQIEVTRRWGRRRKKLLDGLKDRRGYCQLKEETLDHTTWRNRFGRGSGPVVWQITDDDDEWDRSKDEDDRKRSPQLIVRPAVQHRPDNLHPRRFYNSECKLQEIKPAVSSFYCTQSAQNKIPFYNTPSVITQYLFFFRCYSRQNTV